MNKAARIVWLVWFFAMLVFFFISNSKAAITEEEADDNSSERKHFNFASHQAGAVILDKSVGPNGKGFNHLLNDDRDKYGISPCTDMKWIVISLSEEISITSIVLANFEKYSSMVQDFQLFGSVSYPTSEWTDLGTYTAALQQGEQTFNITSAKDAHIRYLKIKVISHYEVESLCTLSQVKVYGITVFASLQQEVQRSRSDDLMHLLQEQESWQEVAADLVDEVDVCNVTAAEPEQTTPPTSNGNNNDVTLTAVAEDANAVSEQVVEVGQVADSSVASSPDPQPTVLEEVKASSTTNSAATDAVNDSQAQVLANEDPFPVDVSITSSDDHPTEGVLTTITDVSAADTKAQAVEPVREDKSQRVALVNDVGDTEEVQVNASEWASFKKVLKDNNQSADSFVGIFKRFINPISKTLDLQTLEKFIFSQPQKTEESTSASQAANADEHNSTSEGELAAPSTVSAETVVSINESVESTLVGEQQRLQVDEALVIAPPIEATQAVVAEKDPPVIVHPEMDKSITSISAASVAASDTNSDKLSVDSAASTSATPATTAIVSKPDEQQQQPAAPAEVQQPGKFDLPVQVESPPKTAEVSNKQHEVPDAQTQMSMNLPLTNASITAVNSSNVVMNSSINGNGSFKPGNKTTKLTINCLEQLRFPEFQAKMIAKLQANKNGTNGGDDQIANSKDNVFKQMMNRIKSLESNQLITEVYISQTTDCFRVIKEQLIDGKKDGHSDGPIDPSSTTAEGLLNLSINNGLASSRSNTNATNKQRAPGPNRQKNTSVMGLLSLTFSRLMFAKDEEEKLVALRYFVEFIRENAVDFWMTVCILLLSSVILFAMSALMICCMLMGGERKR